MKESGTNRSSDIHELAIIRKNFHILFSFLPIGSLRERQRNSSGFLTVKYRSDNKKITNNFLNATQGNLCQ